MGGRDRKFGQFGVDFWAIIGPRLSFRLVLFGAQIWKFRLPITRSLHLVSSSSASMTSSPLRVLRQPVSERWHRVNRTGSHGSSKWRPPSLQPTGEVSDVGSPRSPFLVPCEGVDTARVGQEAVFVNLQQPHKHTDVQSWPCCTRLLSIYMCVCADTNRLEQMCTTLCVWVPCF